MHGHLQQKQLQTGSKLYFNVSKTSHVNNVKIKITGLCLLVPGAHADNCRSHFCQSCLHCVDLNLNLAKLGSALAMACASQILRFANPFFCQTVQMKAAKLDDS